MSEDARLRKFTCDCGVIARVAWDEFHAKCDDRGSSFKRADITANAQDGTDAIRVAA